MHLDIGNLTHVISNVHDSKNQEEKQITLQTLFGLRRAHGHTVCLTRCLCINWIKAENGLCHISEKVRQCISNIRLISQWWPLVSFWSIKVVSLCCAVLSVALFPSGLLCTFLGPIFSQFLVWQANIKLTACTAFAFKRNHYRAKTKNNQALYWHCASYLRLDGLANVRQRDTQQHFFFVVVVGGQTADP